MTEYGIAGVVNGIGVVDNDDSAVVIAEEADWPPSPMPE
jgi:hypothetical protein